MSLLDEMRNAVQHTPESLAELNIPHHKLVESASRVTNDPLPGLGQFFCELDAAMSYAASEVAAAIAPESNITATMKRWSQRNIALVGEVVRQRMAQEATERHREAAAQRREGNDPRIQALDELLTTPQGELTVHTFLEVMRERANTMDHYYPNSQIARRTRNYLRSLEADVTLAYQQPTLLQRPQFAVDLRRALVESQQRLNNPDAPVRSERLRSEVNQAFTRLAEWL